MPFLDFKNILSGATLILVSAATVVGALTSPARAGDYDADYTCQTKFGRYKIKTASCDDGRVRLVISKNGKTLLDHTDSHYFLIDPGSKDPGLEVSGKKIPTYDLRGVGEQDVIIMTWNGGAHCCYAYDLYSLGSKLTHLWHFDSGDGHLLGLKKSAHSAPYLLIEDSTFRYFQTNVFEMPVVVLRWQTGKFRVDRARMKTGLDRHAPAKIAEVKKYLAQGSQTTLSEYILNLYYCGKAKEANKFIDEVLPVVSKVPTIDSRAEYRAAFLKQLMKSPFYADIKAINDGHL